MFNFKTCGVVILLVSGCTLYRPKECQSFIKDADGKFGKAIAASHQSCIPPMIKKCSTSVKPINHTEELTEDRETLTAKITDYFSTVSGAAINLKCTVN